jgi:O-antigen/teichoic acid export membrane protein
MAEPSAPVAPCDSYVPSRAGTRLSGVRLPAGWRRALEGYLAVSAGNFGRLAIQAVYILLLANTLTLEAMGAFAAVSATGMILGGLAGLGFNSIALRTAAARPKRLGGALALFYATFAVTVPPVLLASALVHAVLFSETLSLPTFLAIVAVEVICWRLVDALQQVNNGLGRFTAASVILLLITGARALAVLVFALAGGGSLEAWTLLYVVANGGITALIVLLFRPRVRLRLKLRLFRVNLKDALLFSTVNVVADMSKDIDKLVLIAIADERAAGIYAISMRVIELAAVPMKGFLVLYSRKLIHAERFGGGRPFDLRIEAATAVLSTLLFLAFLGALAVVPNLLGANVAASSALFAGMLLVPAFRNLMDIHSEVFFAFRKMPIRFAMTLVMIAIKAGGLAALVRFVPESAWGLWLNLLFAALYVTSFVCVRRAVFGRWTLSSSGAPA